MSFKGCFELFLKMNLFQKKLYILDQAFGIIFFSLIRTIEVTVLSVAPSDWNLGHRFDDEMRSKKCFELFLKNQFQKIHMLDQVLVTILFSLEKIIEVTVLPVAPPNWNLGVGSTVFTLK